jgi:hypothetical protein
MGQNFNWFKSYDTKFKYFHFHFLAIFKKKKYLHFFFFAFCVIFLYQFLMWTCYAPQNDRLNLSFVKEEHIVSKKIDQKSQNITLFDNAPPLYSFCPYHTLVAFLARKLAIFSWVINDLGPITLS